MVRLPAFDIYLELGLDPTADRGQIRLAYRRAAKEAHPDVSDVAGSTARMARINAARDVLLDQDRRAEYDRQHGLLSRGPTRTPRTPGPRTPGPRPPRPAAGAGRPGAGRPRAWRPWRARRSTRQETVLAVVFRPTILVEQHVARGVDARHPRGRAGHVGDVRMRLLGRSPVGEADLPAVRRR